MSLSMSSPVCRDCGGETYRQTDSAETKRAARARGARRISGRQLCTTCYARWQRSGGCRPLMRETVEVTGPCVRCGITKRRENPLCTDCEEVAHELSELAAWGVAS